MYNLESPFALVVEAEELIRQFVATVFRMQNYRVLESDNEEEAWHLFEKDQEKIAVVYTDFFLVSGNGINLYRRIRKINAIQEIIIASASYENEISEVLNDSHACYLSKPFDSEILIKKARIYPVHVHPDEA